MASLRSSPSTSDLHSTSPVQPAPVRRDSASEKTRSRRKQRCAGQISRAIAAAAALSIATIAGLSHAATITVTSTGDTVAVDTLVTLREAMMSINAGASVNADVVPVGAYGTADAIRFNIGASGVQTIAPGTALPTMTKPVTIDGYTQPGTSANTHGALAGTNAVLLIELNLLNAGNKGLTFTGGNSVVRGLAINRGGSGGAAIDLETTGGNVIAGNFIGTNPTGAAAGPGNGTGIAINAPNSTIGGTSAADRNLISGNTGTAIACCSSGFASNTFQNNMLGVNAPGTAALGNGQGMIISGTGNVVGSTGTAGRNILSGSGQHGILVISTGSGNAIEGNYIGTDVTGTVAVPNLQDGISVDGTNNTIGGSTAGAGNLISGNTTVGIAITHQGTGSNTIQGNLIGTDRAGTVAIAGHSAAGIDIGPFANGNLIGGESAGQGNVIAFATGNGVRADGAGVTGGTANGILGNSIFGNGKLGIKLGNVTADTVPTPNDPGDTDTGPNTLQNYPILTAAAIGSGTIAISGMLNSTASTIFQVELFANPSCDTSGNGEGKTFLGSVEFETDSGGNNTFGPFPFPPPPAGQRQITATATDPLNNTSEFSPCILATGGPPLFVSAVSRKVHGAAGTFNLPLSTVPTNPTTEPRQSPTVTIVMTFDSAVTGADVAVTEGTGSVGTVTFSGNDVIVPLTGVSDHQYVTLSATNVSSASDTGGAGSIRLGFLLGDVNQNRVVTVADLALVNQQLAQSVTPANYLKDVNASGTLSVADKGLTNANLTRSLPAP